MIGEIINGYKIKSFLGQGTFANTYLVTKNSEQYAMKIFKLEMIRSQDDEIRVKREIKSLQSVNHPNVIRYIDDGQFKKGYDTFKYLVMEYSDGEPLRNYINSRGKLGINQSIIIIEQVLSGLEEIHRLGFLHRDLKPDNIFVRESGEVQILDFGLVKILDASTLTSTGVAMGTFAYMSPEQLKDSKNIDERSDLYSVGAILYHMVTGRLPLDIKSIVEAPYKILSELPKPPSHYNMSIPSTLDNVILNLLEKEPYLREYDIPLLIEELLNLDKEKITSDYEKIKLKLLPRLLHNERSVVENYISKFKLDGIVFPGNFLPKYRKVYDSVKNKNADLIIDPVVYRLAYSKFTGTKSLVDLPYVYSETTKEKPVDFDDIDLCRKRAKNVIDWQLKFDASILVSPFHFIESIDDDWIDKDLIVFKESQKYLKTNNINKQLYIGISVQIENVSDSINAERLVNYYTRINPDGYILMFDINLESKIKGHYYWFTKIVNMLSSQNKPIILSRVNNFGLGMMAFGATGISSGLGYIESFKESLLIDETTGFNIKPKYYIPELMSSFNYNELKDVLEPAMSKKYICHCPFCQGNTNLNFLLKPSIAKGHYLYKKSELIRELDEMSNEGRYNWFVNKTNNAIEELKAIKKATKSKYIKFDYLKTWVESISDAYKSIHEESKETIQISIRE